MLDRRATSLRSRILSPPPSHVYKRSSRKWMSPPPTRGFLGSGTVDLHADPSLTNPLCLPFFVFFFNAAIQGMPLLSQVWVLCSSFFGWLDLIYLPISLLSRIIGLFFLPRLWLLLTKFSSLGMTRILGKYWLYLGLKTKVQRVLCHERLKIVLGGCTNIFKGVTFWVMISLPKKNFAKSLCSLYKMVELKF